MLQKLTIKNIALIDYAEINFTKGLNVLSGETGSGKSVIIDSLNFVLGAKADKSMIRSGSAECLVQAVFEIDEKSLVFDALEEFDIEKDDLLIISRKFSIDGKNSIKVNGVPLTVSMLRKITTPLVDIHGQSEHFYLLKSTNQLNLIDKFGGDAIISLKDSISKLFQTRKNFVNELNKFGGNEHERQIKLDLLRYHVKEIEDCALQEGEEENLKEIKQKLSNQEKIVNALSTLKSCITDENGANDILFMAIKSIGSVSDFSAHYSDISERLNNVVSELDDIADTSSTLLEDFDTSEYNIDSIENRLERIKNVKKKYGDTYEEIVNYLQTSKAEIEKLENFNELADKLTTQISDTENLLFSKYLELSKLRKSVAEKFTKNVIIELRELGMAKADFCINFDSKNTIEQCQFNSENGIDNVEFLFSANNGEPLKPLSSVISGGEMSRFMLSIKAQTAKHNEISTFVFDEIDAGISGVTAKVVAEKFAKIAKDVQVIAISHLPQISSMADSNLLINKIENKDSTTTEVKSLSEEEKVWEIVRLIGGNKDSVLAKLHAEELISKANSYKKNI